MVVLIGLVALLLGIGAGFLLADRRGRRMAGNLATRAALAEQRNTDLGGQLAEEKNLTIHLRNQLAQSQTSVASLAAQLEAERQKLVEQRKLVEEAQTALREAFASLSADALARNNEAFLQLAGQRFATLSTEAAGSLEQRKEQIDSLLKPMRELLERYQLRVGEIEKSRVESYSMLREQLGTLAETQRTLNTQTSQLVTALSRPAVRGQWGEISLRRLVELAGMSSQCDFDLQQTIESDRGRLRPDMVVHLPGGRDIVVDCKTSLDAFLEAAAATDEDVRKSHLKRHAEQVRLRARELGAKSYWSQFAQSPEYVIMFLPAEAFLYAAVEQDSSLMEDCARNRVMICTPMTLLAMLRAVEYGWRQEAASENAEEIRSLGKELYDRIGILLSHVGKIGTSLSTTVEHYNSAVASLESRILVTARKMSELGAGTDKEIIEPSPVDKTARQPQAMPLLSETEN
jgi:DNA recombination protein RmuC